VAPHFRAGAFPLEEVLAAKADQRVSVVVPARDEEATIGPVVATIVDELAARGAVDEVVVIDDGSQDATAAVAAAAGAKVHAGAEVLADHPSGPGKGQAMWRGLHVTSGDVVVFCDADVRGFDGRFVLGLAGPLLARPDLAFVKAHYARPLHGRPGEGGRVTELMARPLVAALFPELSGIVQPLAGECAGRRPVLEAVPFAGGYAVDLGLLIDVARTRGAASIAQCDLGERVHRNRPLTELGPQALAILQLALERSGRDPGPATLVRPGAPDAEVALTRLPPLASLAP
jgi:glucosyl-3-phosphoglycerate synthase